MPKIIENIRENLLAEARKQVMELGYSSMTIRSVAKACGVGVGTVYNYFASKDMLVASFMLTDWQQCMQRIRASCLHGSVAEDSISARNGPEVVGGISARNDAKSGDAVQVQTNAVVDKALKGVYDELKGFMSQYVTLFQDESAGVSFATALPQRHGQLRSQIAEPLRPLCEKQDKAAADFLAEFVAESMLTWTMAGRTYEEISSILLQLF